jgi:hypothetical protein
MEIYLNERNVHGSPMSPELPQCSQVRRIIEFDDRKHGYDHGNSFAGLKEMNAGQRWRCDRPTCCT